MTFSDTARLVAFERIRVEADAADEARCGFVRGRRPVEVLLLTIVRVGSGTPQSFAPERACLSRRAASNAR
jgi:hypothetical protein